MNRWERLLEQRPRPVVDHLLDEVARLLSRELLRWPPAVEALDGSTGASFAPLFEPGRPPPSEAVYPEAFRLARMELRRELDALDDYMRNRRYLEHGVAPGERLALQFLSRWLVEQLLGLSEATEGRVGRPLLAECLERTERALREARAGRS